MSSVISNNGQALGAFTVRPPSVFIVASTATRNALPNLILGDIAYVNSTTYYQLTSGDSTLDASWSIIAAPPAAGTANLLNGLTNSIPYQSAPSTTTFLSTGTGVLVASGGAPSWSVNPSLSTVTFVDGSILSSAADFRNTVAVTTSTHTVTATEDYVGVNYNGAVAITLTTVNKKKVVIKDESFAAATVGHTITITPSSGLIEGQANITITVNGMALTLICSAGNWWVV